MRILITNHFPLAGSGSGVYVANIAEQITKQGHKVCIIMPENTTKIQEIPNVKIHPVYFKNKEKIKNQQDFNFICFDPHPRSDLLFSCATDNQIKEYEKAFKEAIEEEIRDFKPDIIHAQHIWIISSVAVNYNIPVVITSHGSDMMGYNESNRYHFYANNAADKCKKIIAISNKSNIEICETFSNNKEKVITMPNGYNPKMFYRYNINKDEIYRKYKIDKKFNKIITFAGRLAKNKGVDLLLKSAKFYEKENILTIIAGFGSEYEYLYNLKKELNLKNIMFLGDQSQDNLREIYNISDVCVIPSREEAFGLVALESIACGTPVIATNQGGLPDFVTKYVGILVEKENIQELTKAITEVLNNKKEFNKEYLEKYAKDNYSQEVLINKLIDVYKDVISEGTLNGI